MISGTSILILFGVLFFCLLIGVPIGFTLGLSGLITILTVGQQFMIQVPLTLNKTLSEFVFVAIPLYVLMGEILYRGKSGERIFFLINSWLGRIRGGTGVATVSAYTFFAAIVGSSMASVLTIGKIAIPEMEKQRYNKEITYGLSAVGGSLGMLIPPSMGLLLYASLTGVSPSKLFLAGIVPGLLIAGMLAVWVMYKSPKALKLPEMDTVNKSTKKDVIKAIPDLSLPIIVLGGIYAGIYSPTEAAAVGVVYALIISFGVHKSLKVKDLGNILLEATKTTAMLLTIVVGALVFGSALTLVGLSDFLAGWIEGLNVAPWVVLLAMNLIWLVMGFFLEVVSILLITTPMFFPIIMALGYDPIWFGILMMINMELAVITPPVGMNLFAIKTLVPEESMGKIIKGVMPSIVIVLIALILVWLFPNIAIGIL
ncbi:TRAP transporter large permease [Lysinibacillus sp. BW-2-10]|uniref:TRAP transporter large permease n=1 Tax=Lysinibacillus sp. BW-2-10 TaxID=2590030 RepID=UPI00118061F9|nr:TRAP transporter large permease subunit [Lysinibacillus sp. BW-2-10]TSI09305.1 TRAP transporter large permease subunit [Lysinibacillus sp. BW-2-10]